MPRVTRRSLAATEDKGEKSEPQPTRSRGRRGAKAAEPEDAGSVDEPQETPAKQGRRGARVKEATPKVEAPKSRASSRSGGRGRGKTEVEPSQEDDDEEEEEEEKEEKVAPKRGSRARGRGGKGRGRSSGRSSRGKAAEQEEEEEEEEMEEEVNSAKPAEEPKVASRGGRGRGKKQTVEEDESEETTEAKEETKTTPTKGRQRTPTKALEPETPPSSGKRRSGRRGQAAEDVAAPEPAEEQEEKNKAEEEMEAEDTQPKAGKTSEIQQKEEKEESVGQKRKHEDESDQTLKRARLSDTAPVTSATGSSKDESKDELADFVVVRKEDVPAADSKEVVDAHPPVNKVEDPVEKEKSPEKEEPEDSTGTSAMEVTKAEEVEKEKEEPKMPEAQVTKEEETMEVEESKKPEETPAQVIEVKQPEAPSKKKTDETSAQPEIKEAIIPEIPIVVPLTEAELAKQYNPTTKDRDETSSTMVEVGSEAASDVMSSTRNLDVSDAVSMDATTSEPPSEESNVSSVSDIASSKRPDSVAASKVSSCVGGQASNSTLSDIPLPSVVNSETPTPAVNSDTPQQPAPAVPLNSIPLPPSFNANSTESSTSSSVSPNLPTTNINATQNGNVQSNEPIRSVPLLTSTPAKRPNFASLEGYVPSSVSFEKRKFMINPDFPIEMFDTAFCFSVVSYNILADVHMRRSDYSYTEPQYLDQSYRHKVLSEEIEYLDGDIVCLQEVNPTYYNNVLSPLMKSKGYEGVIMKRTQDWYDEGEATFVKTAKFEILSHQRLSLQDLAYKEIDAGGLSEEVTRAAKKYLDRADVIVLSKLLSKKTGKTLTVCNIHIVWDMESPDVQCIQAACAIKELVSVAGSDLNPYIICGDFNSSASSPVYHLIKEGYLSDAHIRNLQALEKMDNTDGSSRSLINHLWRAFQHTSSNLKSAYEAAVGKEPVLTSFTKVTHDVCDYIFYSASSLYTVGALEVIDQQVLEATGGLPSKDIPSDHVSMKAVFRLKE